MALIITKTFKMVFDLLLLHLINTGFNAERCHRIFQKSILTEYPRESNFNYFSFRDIFKKEKLFILLQYLSFKRNNKD